MCGWGATPPLSYESSESESESASGTTPSGAGSSLGALALTNATNLSLNPPTDESSGPSKPPRLEQMSMICTAVAMS